MLYDFSIFIIKEFALCFLEMAKRGGVISFCSGLICKSKSLIFYIIWYKKGLKLHAWYVLVIPSMRQEVMFSQHVLPCLVKAHWLWLVAGCTHTSFTNEWVTSAGGLCDRALSPCLTLGKHLFIHLSILLPQQTCCIMWRLESHIRKFFF